MSLTTHHAPSSIPGIPGSDASGSATGIPTAQSAPPGVRRATVAVYASDPILYVGIVHQLRRRPEVEVVDTADADTAQVSLVAVDSVDDETAALLYRLRHNPRTRTGLVVGTFESGDALQRAIECGVTAVLRRAEADQDRLLRLVLAIANGEGVLPGDLLAKLLTHVGSLQRAALDPHAASLSTLAPREADMLRLVSEGLDTAEIARKTSYSERTVKNVLHEVITRLQLRNRTHAVGYALRNGLI
ncbi:MULTISPECIES: helix-turn-helix transcriptional regulator [Streptomyces]|uniref:Transcriptional regulator, LuxR family n=1 Tax=Streptomyces venezuelae (strain ATCC 10712 / CBS 650.69 / DSM 40230 / JCM 4526 / NBRC 13096 / PD 04745) TaxID=953739 RepID=F2RAR9_STRVP|nr:response regulator transcription factor [Streptomyces venezuelae]APE24660.1 helix-turn-helix transcriptional regulator [Streptomyces venezuelae]QES02012.1 DNA-binding response regulator [Streptomyces venezuelae ATCC 10712]QES08985.1 DNA-binding response regulator [Streptomyces venezuelae]CCA59138.1 transcriptional regulator, LuxR family [Streptomyces venezuelae ATCC 10712]